MKTLEQMRRVPALEELLKGATKATGWGSDPRNAGTFDITYGSVAEIGLSGRS